jgi:hypothetical protein
MTRTTREFDAERGAALVTALVFLIVITLLSVASMRSSTVGVRMALNEEARFAAAQTAQALTEAIIAAPANTAVYGGPGFANCTAGEAACDIYNITLPSPSLDAEVAAGHLTGRVERLTPADKPPPRAVESSLDKFSAATFQVTATYDRTDAGLGRAQVTEGLLILVSK